MQSLHFFDGKFEIKTNFFLMDVEVTMFDHYQVGLTRQGVVCELCGFACHTVCCQKVPTLCPVPSDQTKRPLGIDPTRGNVVAI